MQALRQHLKHACCFPCGKGPPLPNSETTPQSGGGGCRPPLLRCAPIRALSPPPVPVAKPPHPCMSAGTLVPALLHMCCAGTSRNVRDADACFGLIWSATTTRTVAFSVPAPESMSSWRCGISGREHTKHEWLIQTVVRQATRTPFDDSPVPIPAPLPSSPGSGNSTTTSAWLFPTPLVCAPLAPALLPLFLCGLRPHSVFLSSRSSASDRRSRSSADVIRSLSPPASPVYARTQVVACEKGESERIHPSIYPPMSRCACMETRAHYLPVQAALGREARN